VLWDDNRISIDGPTDLTVSDDQLARFKAAGWHATAVDGHHPEAIAGTLAEAQVSDRPTLIACRTTIAYGAPKKAGTAASHGAPLGAEEIAGARAKLGWNHPAFEVPPDVLAAWRSVGTRSDADYRAWSERLATAPEAQRLGFERQLRAELPAGLAAAIETLKAKFAADGPKLATRQASGEVLDALAPLIPELIGGSADLTGSNNTKPKGAGAVTKDDYAGRYIYYGVREHAMAAAMNGLALHGGFIPYSGTFLQFADYCRPAIRLAAMMHQRVIHVMTHDSIGLGEDGPTHQPVEHLASLRAIPNLHVFRPADAVETAECWALALALDGPSVLALTRQAVPTVRTSHEAANRSARGGYVLAEASGSRRVTLVATGSEVAVALEARAQLERDGVPTAVVSLPCWRLFDAQDKAYRAQVLGTGVRLAVEAASPFGWERYVGDAVNVIGMTSFGASAPADDLFRHFGITPAAVVAAAKARAA
jgi:transketolase